MHPNHPGHYISCAICCAHAASRLVTNSAIPSAEEEEVQVIEVSSDDEEVVEVPSAEEEVVEVQMIEVPSAQEEGVQVIEVPSAAAEEVTMEAKLCCKCKGTEVVARDLVTCASCTEVYIHRHCLRDSDRRGELCWYCGDCDDLVQVSLSVQKTGSGREYKVKDDQLSTDVELGRTLICCAENQLHGLMAYRHKFGQDKVLSGARISCSLVMCEKSAVLIETLAALGAEVRCCSCITSPICDVIVSAIIARDTVSVFAWDGLSVEEYWLCIEKCMDWGSEGGPHLIVDNGGDATLFVHEGVRVEDEYEKSGKLVDPDSARNAKSKTLLKILRARLLEDPKKYNKISKTIIGVSEESASGVNLLYQMQKEGQLLFSALNVADAVTNRRSFYGSEVRYYGSEVRPYIPNRLMSLLLFSVGHVTSQVAAGKVAVVCGYGDSGKGCTIALKKAGAHVMVTEIDPICALQAMMEGFEVVTLEDVLTKADIFITATSSRDVVMVGHMERMKHGAIVCNVGTNFAEIDVNGLQRFPGIRIDRVEIFNSLIDCYVFPSNRSIFVLAEDQDRDFNLGWFSLTNHALAQSELWNQKFSGRYEKKVYVLPKHLDEVVARLHLTNFNGKNGKLTELTQSQANYLGVSSEGPYKRDEYRY